MDANQQKIVEILATSNLPAERKQEILLAMVVALAPAASQMQAQAAASPITSEAAAASSFWEFLMELIIQLLPILLSLLGG